MEKRRPTDTPAYHQYALVSGAQADQTILAEAGGVARVHITAAGAASSYVEVYDGTVAAGTRIAYLAGTAVGATVEVHVWCLAAIHVKSVDSGGNLRAIVSGDFQ